MHKRARYEFSSPPAFSRRSAPQRAVNVQNNFGIGPRDVQLEPP